MLAGVILAGNLATDGDSADGTGQPANGQLPFEITLIDPGGNRYGAVATQTFTAMAPWQFPGDKLPGQHWPAPFLQDTKNSWAYDDAGAVYYDIQTTRIGIPQASLNENLNGWRLEVKTDPSFRDNKITGMWLAGGNDQGGVWNTQNATGNPAGTYDDQGGFPVGTFDFGLPHFHDYLNRVPSGDAGVAAVKQFTLVPYQNRSNDPYFPQYHGCRTVIITIGPEDGYTPPAPADGGSWQTVQASRLNTVGNLIKTSLVFENLPNKTYDVYVGAIADFLLGGGTPASGSWDRKSPVHLEIDGTIDTSQILLNQSIVYRETSWGPRSFKTVALDFDKQIAVTGVGLIDGFARLRTTAHIPSGSLTPVDKFFNATLDLQSSYGKGNPTAGWAIDVSGISVKYPPRRAQGTVALNAFTPSVNWWDGSEKTGDRLWMAQLGNAIYNSETGNYQTNPLGTELQTRKTGRVHAWDNQIIGGWVDASDGIETLAPGSDLRRNVLHVNDDALKVMAPGQTFGQNLIHQGYVGSAINLSGYGFSNGPVTGCRIYDTYVHRITQLTSFPGKPPEDIIGGLISNRTMFSRALSNELGKGIFGVQIKNLFVPSFRYDGALGPGGEPEGSKEVNVVRDIGIFSALNHSPIKVQPPEEAAQQINDGSQDYYGLEKIDLQGVTVATGAKPPQCNFNGQWIGFVTGAGGPQIANPQPIDYDFTYAQSDGTTTEVKKNIFVNWGSNTNTLATIGLTPRSLLVTGSGNADLLEVPRFWKDRFRFSRAPGAGRSQQTGHVTGSGDFFGREIPAVFYVGKEGTDRYQVLPGVFTVILDHGSARDKNSVTGIPGSATDWDYRRLDGADYLLTSRRHTQTIILLIDPLGQKSPGNRIAQLQFERGGTIGPKQFLRQANHLGSLTYRQAQLELGLDVGELLGVSPEDRALLAAHAGIDNEQFDFLTNRRFADLFRPAQP